MFNYKCYFEFFIFKSMYCQEMHLSINHYFAMQIQTYIKLYTELLIQQAKKCFQLFLILFLMFRVLFINHKIKHILFDFRSILLRNML